MLHRPVSRRALLAGALGTSALLALPRPAAPAVKKGTSLRLWILKTYVEPTNKAIEVSADDGKKTTEAYQGLARAYLALGKVDDAVATPPLACRATFVRWLVPFVST